MSKINLSQGAETQAEYFASVLLTGYLIGRAMHEPEKFHVEHMESDLSGVSVGGAGADVADAAERFLGFIQATFHQLNSPRN